MHEAPPPTGAEDSVSPPWGPNEGDMTAQCDGKTPVPISVPGETSAPAAEPDRGRSPQLLKRTFAVLSVFAGDKTEWTMTEISAACDLPVPTAHRIVVALARHRFLVRDPDSKRFRLGPAAIALGRAALAANDLPTIAANLLPRLTAETQETSLLTVPMAGHDGAVCLLRVESPHPLRLSVEPGHRLPLHAGASQKVILAYLPEADRDRIVNGELEHLCRNTLETRQSVMDEIATIRERGWAYSLEETNLGVWGVAIALLDAAGYAVAAVGVAGPQVRLTRGIVKTSLAATQAVVLEMAGSLSLTSSCTSPTLPSRLALGRFH
jgi:IclR family transcriptional regulator, acetate operon repressor